MYLANNTALLEHKAAAMTVADGSDKDAAAGLHHTPASPDGGQTRFGVSPLLSVFIHSSKTTSADSDAHSEPRHRSDWQSVPIHSLHTCERDPEILELPALAARLQKPVKLNTGQYLT